MTNGPVAFFLPPDLTAEHLAVYLRDHVPLQASAPAPFERVYFDTFDWRLFNRGMGLEQTCAAGAATWRLVELATGREEAFSGPVELGAGECPQLAPIFANDIPAAGLAATVTPLASIRALLPLAHLVGTTTLIRVFNKDLKTVTRVVVEDARLAGGEPLPRIARLLPVRGYDNWLAEVQALLAAMPGAEPCADDPLMLAVAATGRAPGDYSSGLSIPLDPADRADEAVRAIHRALLETMRRNEAGVRADIDSEFLHDFRVAVRRARSALSQIKGVLPEARAEQLKTELSWLGQLTGPTRDLDVYLLHFEDMRRQLPEHLRDRLDPLRAHLERRQREEHAILSQALASPRYALLVEAWLALLAERPPADAAPENAAVPVGDLASRQIVRAYRRTAREAEAIDAGSPPEQVHELRKTAKKLRYLLEFYSALYPPDELKALVGELKQLQDVLGEYQDLQVQIDSLEHYAAEMQAGGDVPAATLMAIGALTGQLYSRELEVREEMAPVLAQFARPKLRRRFEKVVGLASLDEPDEPDEPDEALGEPPPPEGDPS